MGEAVTDKLVLPLPIPDKGNGVGEGKSLAIAQWGEGLVSIAPEFAVPLMLRHPGASSAGT